MKLKKKKVLKKLEKKESLNKLDIATLKKYKAKARIKFNKYIGKIDCLLEKPIKYKV